MSEPEKIKDIPKTPPSQDQAKEPSATKTSQSAFDKVMEQQKVIQQSPTLQTRVSEQGATEYRVREVAQRQEEKEERQKRDDRDESGAKEKVKLKNKDSASTVVTREAVVRGGEKRGFGDGGKGSGGKDKGGYSSDMEKRQIIQKKIQDIRGLIENFGQGSFANKLASAKAAALKTTPQQMQALVNKIVQSIHVGKNQIGQDELRLIFKENVFAGLRLRFTSKRGRVLIQFETASREVKDLFTAESKKIKAALEEKGVAVDSIQVG
jgi:hypothetical protein